MIQCVIGNRKEVYVLTQEELKQKLHYDPETGVFRWLVDAVRNKTKGTVAGHCGKDGYVRISINKSKHLAHRLAWLYMYGHLPEKGLDHINLSKKDNRIVNLREATQTENLQNRVQITSNKSGYVGAFFEKRTGKWFSKITTNKQQVCLGTYTTAEEAHQAYVKAKAQYHQFQPTLK
jgi:hypothetical protein